MPCRQHISANLPRGDQKLVELQMVVAQAAGNRRSPGKILVNKRTHHVALKTLFMVHHVIRNAKVLGHAARIVHVVNGAAAALHLLRHALATGKPPLVPKLHSQPNYCVTLGAQHGRDGG
jgi:hypothetical protein